MKNLLFCLSLLFFVAFGSVSASAQQCDRNTNSPIRCGFYDEGYQDGVADASSNRTNDYRRYRTKYVAQYETFYRNGYTAGFESVRPTIRWTTSQRNAYDAGYNIGRNDRRNGTQGRAEGQNLGRYDENIGIYFQQGYDDGYNNRPKTYDVVLNQTPGWPGNPGTGGAQGTATWGGRVDDRANIIIRGSTIRSEDVSGTGLQVGYQNVNGSLPRRATTVTATKTGGRGEVFVLQQPNRTNDFTAIIQVVDSRTGADSYRLDISWGRGNSNVEEPYRSGSVRWRGRVDQTANIVISGTEVESQDAALTGLSGVSYDINGYLARRPGNVTAVKRNGRGSVRVLQQPSWDNDFTAIVQVFDAGGGADDYEVDINW